MIVLIGTQSPVTVPVSVSSFTSYNPPILHSSSPRRPHAMSTVNEEEVNPYELLGVTMESTEQDIRTAYRRVSLKVHPDRVGISIQCCVARVLNVAL